MPPSQAWVERAQRERFPYRGVLTYLIRTRGLPALRAEPIAEDAVQSALLQVLRWDFVNEDAFRVLWHRYARLRAIDILDRTPDNKQRQLPEGVDVGREPLNTYAEGEELTWALNQLPSEQRSAVSLYYLQDLTLEQVAALQNISTSTAFNRVRSGLACLRALLQRSEPS